MTQTFVIADIHGRLDLLHKALALTGPGTVIFLGDYIDRGPDSSGVIDVLMAGPHRDDQGRVCLMGNHEHMMLMADGGQMDPEGWIKNGAAATIDSYKSKQHFNRHAEWMAGLGWAFRDQYRAYVHACLPRDYEWGAALGVEALWGRMNEDRGAGGLHLVHGHRPHPQLELLTNRTNLDGGAFMTGRLAVGVFDDDLPGGPIEVRWAE